MTIQGCSSSKVGPGGFCESDGDCASGLVCKQNVCTYPNNGECRPPCKEGEICQNGVCVPSGDGKDKDGDTYLAPPDGNDCNDFDHTIHPGAPDYCDGVDNDCDGATDKGCPKCQNGVSRPCGTDIGECTPGIQVCSAGVWQGCNGVGPQPEACDAKDNDCDGLTDEGCPCSPGQQLACSADVGQCKSGWQVCEEGKWSSVCQGGQLPVPEICDGKDNDCNDGADDGFEIGVACTGLGQCGEGTLECAGEYDTRCSTMPGGSRDQSSPEVCDGVDNDCNGVSDEGTEADNAPDTCTLAQDLGAIPDDGSSKVVAGNLWPSGDEDWYVILAKDDVTKDIADGCDSFLFRVSFVSNPQNTAKIDVYVDSCPSGNPSAVCTDESEKFEYSYNGHFHNNENAPGMGQCPCSANPQAGMATCADESKKFYIRVHAPSGQGNSCDDYQLLITNGVP